MRVRLTRQAQLKKFINTAVARSGYGPLREMRDTSISPASVRNLGMRGRYIAYDTEGTGLIPYGGGWYWGYEPARPFAFSFCDTEGNTAYIRCAVNHKTRQVLPATKSEQKALAAILGDPTVTKIGHNIGYDRRMSREAGLPLQGPLHDTQILAHVATAGDELAYGLKPLAKKYSGFPDTDERQLEQAVAIARRQAKANGWLIAGGKKEVDRGDHVVFAGNKPVKADYWLVPSPSATTRSTDTLVRKYAVGDVERTMLLFQLWWTELWTEPRLMMTYLREMYLFHALRAMEDYGTRVYPERIDYLIKWYYGYMKRQEASARENGGVIWKPPTKTEAKRGIDGQWVLMNFNSPKQLMAKFYDEKKYPVAYKERKNKKTGETKMTPTLGKDELAIWGATDEDTGEFQDPLAKAILEHRAAHQTIKAFLKIYQRFMYPTDQSKRVWILHPNYNQTGAVTGRMTCSDPNLQQVASATTGLRKADIPARPRECFGPRPGCLWYLPDYSQIEVWLFAFMSGEKKMQGQLLAGHDFHQAVASISFGKRKDYEQRKPYYRKMAKLIMFGKLYGGGVGTPENPGRMTRLLQMPFHEAKEFIDSWEETFVEVKKYMKRMSNAAANEGEAWNIYGRKYKLEEQWAYKVVNYLIQGSAADMMKAAMIRMHHLLNSTKWADPKLRMINSVHDEIIIEVPKYLHSMALMKDIIWVMQMDSALAGVPVPLPVGVKIATKRWSHSRELKTEIPKWVQGGIPRTRKQEREFDSVQDIMRTCPPLTLPGVA